MASAKGIRAGRAFVELFADEVVRVFVNDRTEGGVQVQDRVGRFRGEPERVVSLAAPELIEPSQVDLEWPHALAGGNEFLSRTGPS